MWLHLKYMDAFQKSNSPQPSGAITAKGFFFKISNVDVLCRRLEQNPMRNLFGHGPELMTMEHLASEVRKEL